MVKRFNANKILFTWVVLIFSIVVFSQGVWAGAGIKARMDSRIKDIVVLKSQGVVGENALGFLELRVPGNAGAAIVSAENQDRGLVYQKIAKKTGGTAEQVGRQVAKKRAQQAAKGDWIQGGNGQWYRK